MAAETEIDRWMDAAGQTLEILRDTFGADDERYQIAHSNYGRILRPGSPIAYLLGAMYVNWCASNPGRIGESPMKGHCRCTMGFVQRKVNGELTNTWRPCNKCLPVTYENWQKENGYSD